MPHVFNFCFTDTGECINNVLKIMSYAERFANFVSSLQNCCRFDREYIKVNLVSAKAGHPYNCVFLIQTIPLNAFRLMSGCFL